MLLSTLHTASQSIFVAHHQSCSQVKLSGRQPSCLAYVYLRNTHTDAPRHLRANCICYAFNHQTNTNPPQHVRRYATEPPKGGNNALLFGGIGAAVLGGTYYAFGTSPAASPTAQHGAGHESAAKGQPASKEEEKNIPAIASEASKCFKGGDQGFIGLTLDKVEPLSGNTKLFRFKLPESESVSGLSVASALITKYKGPEMQKPVIRPYTPVSDEGKLGRITIAGDEAQC